MNLLLAIFIVVLLGVVVAVVSAPLRAARRSAGTRSAQRASPRALERAHRDAVLERDELEAAREAKYREIRDAELDYRTGKLSREHYEAIDRELRAEAVHILDRLEGADGREARPGDGDPLDIDRLEGARGREARPGDGPELDRPEGAGGRARPPDDGEPRTTSAG